MNPAPVITGLTYIRPLGSGGYCDVLLYEQDEPRMNVAVKVLTTPGVSAQRRRRFTAEGNAMATLADHPFIVAVYRAGVTADERPFLVMPFYPEPNLAERSRHERIPVAEVLRIGVQVSSAVETAHRSGILHRDIKPANVLGGPYGNPGLTDFGLAAVIAGPDAPAEGVSVPWAPPEVVLESSPPDVRGDVYSLAATIWHLLVGRSPFEQPGADNSGVALRERILRGSPTPLGRADVPDSLDRLLRQAMAVNPQLRPTSALALARGLQRIEQELRLPLTQIVVPAGARLAQAASTSSTRVRAAIPRPAGYPSAHVSTAQVSTAQVSTNQAPAQTPPAHPPTDQVPPAHPPTAGPGRPSEARAARLPTSAAARTPPPAGPTPAPAGPTPPSPLAPSGSDAAGSAEPPAPVYGQWPPPVEDWSEPVLSTSQPPAPQLPALGASPKGLWTEHRAVVVAAAIVVLAVLVTAIVLLG